MGIGLNTHGMICPGGGTAPLNTKGMICEFGDNIPGRKLYTGLAQNVSYGGQAVVSYKGEVDG